MGARRRPTPTRTGSARSPSFTTGSSRTTWRCARGSRSRDASSSRRLTPRSSPISSTRRCKRERHRWWARCGWRLRQVHGAYALAVVSEQHPGQIVAAKMASPLVLGLGKGETFLASDVPAFLEHTREVVFLDDRRHRGDHGRRREDLRPRGQPDRAPVEDHHLGRGAGRKRRLPALHAQGNPRAAARDRRHAARAPATSRPATPTSKASRSMRRSCAGWCCSPAARRITRASSASS